MRNSSTKRSLVVAILLYLPLSLAGCNYQGRYVYNEAERHYNAGRNSEAIAAFSEAIKQGYNLKESYAMRGLAYYKIGEYDLAIADNNKALEISPTYAPAYNGRGLAYYRKGDIDRTIADMEQVLKYTNDQTLVEPATKVLEGLKARKRREAAASQ